MSFLYPLFLLGGIAVVLPVIFHLIRRQARKRIPFSTLQFLEPSPPSLTRKSRLEHLWLLLLRCLILLLLALAFARPFLRDVLVGASETGEGEHHVYLLDISASMGRAGARERSLEMLADLVDQVGEEVTGAIYGFDTRLYQALSFAEWRAAAGPAERMGPVEGAVPVTERATHLGHAILGAVELLEGAIQTEEEVPEKPVWKIHVVSDMQAGMMLEGLQGFEWPERCGVHFHRVRVEGDTNVGIHVLPYSELASGLSEQESFRIRITSTDSSQQETFRYGWSGEEENAFYLPPGQSRILRVPSASGGEGNLIIDGDDHTFDNEVWQVPLRARESRVLYLGNDSPSDPDAPLFYLQKAFQQTRRHMVTVDAHPPDRVLADAALERVRLIVVGDVLDAQLAEQVERANAEGATLLLLLHRNGMEPVLRSLLRDTGATLLPDAPPDYALLGEVDFRHPLFSGFADPRYSNFTRIRFWNYRVPDIPDPGEMLIPARFDDGNPAILELPRGTGRLVVMAFGWQRRESNFALSTKFVPFLYSLLDMGLKAGEIRSHYLVGQQVDISSLQAPVTIATPSGSTVTAEGPLFPDTRERGIYTVESEGETIRFAVNLDPAESDTIPLSEDVLLGLRIPGGEGEVPVRASRAANPGRLQDREIEDGQKFWRWAVVAALAFFFLETILSAWITRYRTVPAQ